MGGRVTVTQVGGPRGLLDESASELDRLESLWSRFLSDSELSQLNEAASESRAVDPATVTLIRAIQAGDVETAGASTRPCSDRLPPRFWEGLNYASYAAVLLISLRAGLTGTDASHWWYRSVSVVIISVTAAAIVVRLVMGSRPDGAAAARSSCCLEP